LGFASASFVFSILALVRKHGKGSDRRQRKQVPGQGETDGGAQIEHHRRKRFSARKYIRWERLTFSGIADAIRSSLGPKGMDKMIQTENTTIITNDGATILKHMAVLHPAARMVLSPFSVGMGTKWAVG
jgi:hypothetical protein